MPVLSALCLFLSFSSKLVSININSLLPSPLPGSMSQQALYLREIEHPKYYLHVCSFTFSLSLCFSPQKGTVLWLTYFTPPTCSCSPYLDTRTPRFPVDIPDNTIIYNTGTPLPRNSARTAKSSQSLWEQITIQIPLSLSLRVEKEHQTLLILIPTRACSLVLNLETAPM